MQRNAYFFVSEALGRVFGKCVKTVFFLCVSLLGGARERKLKDVLNVLHGFEIFRKLGNLNLLNLSYVG